MDNLSKVSTGEGNTEGIKSFYESSKDSSPIKMAHEEINEPTNWVQKFFSAPCTDESSKHTKYVTIGFIAAVLLMLLYILFPETMVPNGQLFILIALVVLSYLSGRIVALINLPPLLGMLICGIVLRNIDFYKPPGGESHVVSTIREIALAVILLKAGLGLDATALLKLSFVVARLAFTPCIAEAAGAAVAAYFIVGLPWEWGFLLGFILSAVSPAVVVPTLLKLKEKGYGENKGISTLVIAASSIDDIISISGFGVMLGLVFSQGDTATSIIQCPLEVLIGVSGGLIWGVICGCIPQRNEDDLVVKRVLMVGVGSMVAVLGCEKIDYKGSGPLFAIIAAFIASLCWKWQGWSNNYNPVATVFNSLWKFMEPLLFGLIGTEIRFDRLNPSLVGESLAVLFFGLLIRTITCCIVLVGSKLNKREVVFVNLAWLPKATVQAVLGPVALDLARDNREEGTVIHNAEFVLTIAVLSILITAPIGAIGIAWGGPRLLTPTAPLEDKKTPEEPIDIDIDDRV